MGRVASSSPHTSPCQFIKARLQAPHPQALSSHAAELLTSSGMSSFSSKAQILQAEIVSSNCELRRHAVFWFLFPQVLSGTSHALSLFLSLLRASALLYPALPVQSHLWASSPLSLFSLSRIWAQHLISPILAEFILSHCALYQYVSPVLSSPLVPLFHFPFAIICHQMTADTVGCKTELTMKDSFSSFFQFTSQSSLKEHPAWTQDLINSTSSSQSWITSHCLL